MSQRRFSLKKSSFLLVICFLFSYSCLVLSTAAAAQNFHADVGIGSVAPTNSGYETGYALDHAIAYEHSIFVFRLGGMFLGSIEPEDAAEDTEIDIGGVYLNVAGVIELAPVKIELGTGVLFSETRADFMGRRVSEESDQSPFAGVKVILGINKLVSLQADWKYIDDVTGGNLNVVNAGVRFSF
ncbi:hypothetical protein [Agarilytica rhodophyticola]|uniref:hypothetical protein n=1 Tax=Agarilytica rhodophyticola TaxID=1737490 RepID=UPI000B345822|nr:hypothetical protein [Agarilytica rhodophyticola]